MSHLTLGGTHRPLFCFLTILISESNYDLVPDFVEIQGVVMQVF